MRRLPSVATLIAVAVLATTLAAAGCGGSADQTAASSQRLPATTVSSPDNRDPSAVQPTGPVTTESSPDPGAAASRPVPLTTSLLFISDFPADWKSESQSDDDDTDAGYCGDLPSDLYGVASGSDVAFTGDGVTVSAYGAHFDDTEAADATFDAIQSRLSGCDELRGTLYDGSTLTFALDEAPVDAGDESIAVTTRATKDAPFLYEVVVMRVGAKIGVVGMAGFATPIAPDLSEMEGWARLVAERLAADDETPTCPPACAGQ